jgi:hypothetical protein
MRLDTWTREITEVNEKSRMDSGADGIRRFPPFPTTALPSKISTLESYTVLTIMTRDKVYCVRQIKTFVDTFGLLLQVGNVKAQRCTQQSVPNWAISLQDHMTSRLNIHRSHNFVLNSCKNH